MGDHITIPMPVEDWYRIEAKKTDSGPAKASLHIYDAIGGWFGIRVSDLVKELAAVEADEIEVFLNSPGGDAFGGLAIMNALRRHGATVTVHVDGLAASAASMVAMGGDEVVMGRGAQMMIHDTSTIAWGPAAVMEKTRKLLDKLSNSYAHVYAARAGGTRDEWREAMKAESWYTAEEAVEAGLANRLIDTDDEPDSEDVEAVFDLSIYDHAGRSKAPDPMMPKRFASGGVMTGERGPELVQSWSGHFINATSVAEAAAASPAPGDETTKKEESMAFIDDVRQRLGADADADEAAVLEALDARLARPNVPEGTKLIEATQLDQLQADAAAGRVAREAQLKAEREGLIDQAVRDGRIAPARRAHWLAQLEADAGLAEVIAGLPQIINTTEAGYTGGVDESSTEDDAVYAKFWGEKKEG